MELLDGRAEGGGLARPGRADHEDDGCGAGDRCGRFPLGARGLDRAPLERRTTRPCLRGVDATAGPVEDERFLFQDPPLGDRTIRRCFGDRTVITRPPLHPRRDRRAELHPLAGADAVAEDVRHTDHLTRRRSERGREQRGDLADDLGRTPRRLLLRQRIDRRVHQPVLIEHIEIALHVERTAQHPRHQLLRINTEITELTRPTLVEDVGADRVVLRRP